VVVEENVDEEDDVDDAVGGELSDVVDGLAVERRVVRHHDGRVVSQNEDEPVPGAPEARVVQHDVLRSDWRGGPILRQRRLCVGYQLYSVIRTSDCTISIFSFHIV